MPTPNALQQWRVVRRNARQRQTRIIKKRGDVGIAVVTLIPRRRNLPGAEARNDRGRLVLARRRGEPS